MIDDSRLPFSHATILLVSKDSPHFLGQQQYWLHRHRHRWCHNGHAVPINGFDRHLNVKCTLPESMSFSTNMTGLLIGRSAASGTAEYTPQRKARSPAVGSAQHSPRRWMGQSVVIIFFKEGCEASLNSTRFRSPISSGFSQMSSKTCR